MSFRSFSVLAALLLFSACGSDPSSTATPSTSSSATSALEDSSYTAAVRALVEQDTALYAGGHPDLRRALQRFYANVGYTHAWTGRDGLRTPAEALLEALRTAEDEGLPHAGYEIERLGQLTDEAYADGEPQPETLAKLDALLSFTFMRHARDLYSGRLSPEAVDPTWYTDREHLDWAALQEKALGEASLDKVLRQLTPDHEGYRRLREAMQRYRQIAQNGGWAEVPAGKTLAVGDTSARVAALRQRLAATGDLEGADTRSRVFDERLAGALARFQARHNLTADSVLGEATRQALNVPASERVRTIQLNLERWHWLPKAFGPRYVLVNIPEFKLRAYDQGRQAEEMAVVVGKEYDDRATPIFSDKIEHLIFSPYWNVPPGIANEEILPKARRDHGYLAANGYEITSHYGPGAEVYDVTTQNLDRVAAGDLRIRQQSGPDNALGLVKFMFPNQHAVYLHDTPADHLFSKPERAFSHGCVRVERPADLAAYALANKSGWDRARIEEAMRNGEWQKVPLPENIPVYLLYWTAYVDKDAEGVQFREDFYGHDVALDKALRQAAS